MSTPLSLLQHFQAPEDYRGNFGWLCGYSADDSFMDIAAERFSRRSHAQRAHEGQPLLALMTDPDHQPIAMTAAPGVVHLPWRADRERPFRLLHAKLAILGFRHETEPEQWHVRLIVSTGNWTLQTVEQSLDLACRLDLNSGMLAHSKAGTIQDCADLAAAWQLLRWLSEYFDTRLLNALRPGENSSPALRAQQELTRWLVYIAGCAGDKPPRLFDSRQHSLLAQLPAQVKRHAGVASRNYLLMGSGFYEGGECSDQVPPVLRCIVAALRDEGLLSARAALNLVVNPQACQAVATAQAALQRAGYQIHAASQPADVFGERTPRFLHAKFLFSAMRRESKPCGDSPWVYLGSGNLTGPGFTQSMSAGGGNLEAGIVFAPAPLHWLPDTAPSPECWLGRQLPFDSQRLPLAETTTLQPGADMPEHDAAHIAAPLAWLHWQSSCLAAPQGDAADCCIVTGDGHYLLPDAMGRWHWPGERPLQVTLAWPASAPDRQARIPVMDELGRLAASELLPLELDQAVWQLLNFPGPARDEDDEPDGDGDGDSGQSGNGGRRPEHTGVAHPIRIMMEMVEQIAARQCEIAAVDWQAWCARLEQTLQQAADSRDLAEFKKLGINPLSPLWHAPFRPSYAEDSHSATGLQYEALLDRLERRWQVETLRRIGDPT